MLGVTSQTLYNHMKEEPEIQFVLDRGRENGRSTLRRLQWQKANAGSDTMLIWLGKQLLGQKDKSEHDVRHSGSSAGALDSDLAAIALASGSVAAPSSEPPTKPQGVVH